MPEGKKRPRSLRSLGLASLLLITWYINSICLILEFESHGRGVRWANTSIGMKKLKKRVNDVKGAPIEPVPTGCVCIHMYVLFFLFFSRFRRLSSRFFSLPPINDSRNVVTQIRGHIAGSSPPPSPLQLSLRTVRALHFCREEISALSSLVDSRRIVLTHARRSQQLLFMPFYLFIFASKSKISPRRDSNSRTNTMNSNGNSSTRGLPLYHRGHRLYTSLLLFSSHQTVLCTQRHKQ